MEVLVLVLVPRIGGAALLAHFVLTRNGAVRRSGRSSDCSPPSQRGRFFARGREADRHFYRRRSRKVRCSGE
jgi:hypothetical protein